MSEIHKCLAGCGKTITWRFAICKDCEQIYGSKSEEWPDWLRFLWSDTLRERRERQTQIIFESEFSDEDYAEVVDGKVKRHNGAD
jgi:hypothetical protein